MELPPYDEAKVYVDSFLAVVHPVIPVLSKSWLHSEIARLYSDDSYVPTPQTCVIVNMVFAIITSSVDFYQRKVGSLRSTYSPLSQTFYKRIFPYFSELHRYPDLASVQAIVLVLVYLRPSPRPRASWVLGRMATTIAIQIGLHRENFLSTNSKFSLREQQLRKRVFWSLLSLECALSNRLGRPHALHVDNFDTELPLSVDDEYLDGQIDYQKLENACSFVPAIALFGLTKLSSSVFCSFYAVKQPTAVQYEQKVLEYEAELAEWGARLPEILTWKPSDSTGDLSDKRYAGIMWLTYNELHLFIRHPSASRTLNQSFNNASRSMCVSISRELLHTMNALMKINHVESTWFNITMLLTSLFTILYGVWAKQDTTQDEIMQVKEDVEIALAVIDEIAKALGTDVANNRLRKIVLTMSFDTIKKLEDRYSEMYYAQMHHRSIVQQQQVPSYPEAHMSQQSISQSIPQPMPHHSLQSLQPKTTAEAHYAPIPSLPQQSRQALESQPYIWQTATAGTASGSPNPISNTQLQQQQQQQSQPKPSPAILQQQSHPSWQEYVYSEMANMDKLRLYMPPQQHFSQNIPQPLSSQLTSQVNQHQQKMNADTDNPLLMVANAAQAREQAARASSESQQRYDGNFY